MPKKLLISVALLTWGLSADAAIIIHVETKNLAADGFGFVEVDISSDEMTVDNLASASYEFQIVPTGPNGDSNGQLLFRADGDQSTDDQGDPNYVFFGDSAGITATRQLGKIRPRRESLEVI